MNRLFIGVFLLAVILVGSMLIAGEDAGVAGAAYMRIQNLPAGSLTDLSLRFKDDSDTGFWSPAANSLQIRLGNVKWTHWNQTDETNVAIGAGAMSGSTDFSGTANTAFGAYALGNLSLGSSHTAVGYAALQTCVNSGNNTAVGQYAGTNTGNGSGNSFFGDQAGKAMTGNSNVAVGQSSFGNNTTTTGSRNVGIGLYSGQPVTGGSDNVFVGGHTTPSATQSATVNNSTAIGANTYTTVSNQAVIGDANVNDVRFGQSEMLRMLKGKKLTADATATRLTLDGAADGSTNRWSIASGTACAGEITVVGVATSSTRLSCSYNFRFHASRVNSTVTVATMSRDIYEAAGLEGCDADLVADSANNSFYVAVVGSTTTNIRWNCVAKFVDAVQP